jgi:uncharacterized caspase-like protein
MKRAVLIGINYTGQPRELSGPHTDVDRICVLLTEHFAYAKENITIMVDGGVLGAIVPAKQSILLTLDDLVTKSQPGDTLLVYFSGHGSSIQALDVILPLDYDVAGTIDADTIFKQLIQRIPSGVALTCLFDCCHSGGLCKLENNYVYASPRMASENFHNWGNHFVSWKEQDRAVRGSVKMLSSCSSTQSASDVSAWQGGAFTSLLLRSLENHQYRTTNKNIVKEINCSYMLSSLPQKTVFSCSDEAIFIDAIDL